MPYIQYRKIRMRRESIVLIDYINEVIKEYQKQGYTLTLRQVYYQLVARGLIPNNEKSYRMIGTVVNDGRICGYIDWSAIEDRTRNIRTNSHWNTPADILESAAYSYYLDHWKEQTCYVEVWVEKDALIGVVEQVCHRWDVPCFSCRGYTSQSEMWAGSQRFISASDNGHECHLLHLGDHDPSGIDMSRDIDDRLRFFGADVKVERIALTMEQVEAFSPPPNPAKLTDSRASSYIQNYGDESWELDALSPSVIEETIVGALSPYVSMLQFSAVDWKIDEGKEQLNRLARNWDKVIKYKFMQED